MSKLRTNPSKVSSSRCKPSTVPLLIVEAAAATLITPPGGAALLDGSLDLPPGAVAEARAGTVTDAPSAPALHARRAHGKPRRGERARAVRPDHGHSPR